MLMINLIRKVKLLHEVQIDYTSLGFAEVWKWLTSWLPDLGGWFRRITGLIILAVLTFVCYNPLLLFLSY